MTYSFYEGTAGKRTQKKLLVAFGLITLVFVVLFLVILPYEFYRRDVDEARHNAQNISRLIRAAVLSHMIEGANPKSMRDLLATFQTQFDFEFRLIRSDHVMKQHGFKEDPQSKDELIKEVLQTGRGREDWPGSTQFRYVAPFVADERCQRCHWGLNGQSIEIGSVLGVSEIIFELKDIRNTSIRQIIEVTLLMIAGLIILGLVLFFIVKKGILDPMGIK
ncbi:MAG: DUF3365 domain-containing protein [Deltaproteobacteria bacterium]|nr:DUF3365 domain-containing protein [Deltaproteobacteria bacterium]MBW2153293.1 DUF3365 domain-containing protein [Deltaproteobacteria bacterium]